MLFSYCVSFGKFSKFQSLPVTRFSPVSGVSLPMMVSRDLGSWPHFQA